MSVSHFVKAFMTGHKAFQAAKGEEILVEGHGPVMAIEVAEMTAAELLSAGGKYADNSVTLYVFQSDAEAAGMVVGKKLTVRGRRCRIDSVADNGDGVLMMVAGPAGVRL